MSELHLSALRHRLIRSSTSSRLERSCRLPRERLRFLRDQGSQTQLLSSAGRRLSFSMKRPKFPTSAGVGFIGNSCRLCVRLKFCHLLLQRTATARRRGFSLPQRCALRDEVQAAIFVLIAVVNRRLPRGSSFDANISFHAFWSATFIVLMRG